jgi:hypothetical protein
LTTIISGDTGISPVTPSGTSASVDGMTVGRGGGEVSTNTAVGTSALNSNTTGATNTVVGYQAGYSNQTGADSTAIGSYALYTSTAGGNTAVGRSAGVNTTSGGSNTIMGAYALYSNTTASGNTAVGYQAGYSNQTGAQSVFVGYQAGYNTTGTQNTFVGASNSGYSVTTGAKNTILGAYSGNQGGLDIRTSSNYIVLSDGDGNPNAYCATNSGWTFGKGGTGSTNDGGMVLNGSSVSGGYGSYINGLNNSVDSWLVGTYKAAYGGTSTFLLCRNTSGGVYLNGAGATSWTSASDERLKENFEPITDAVNKVASLRAVVGNYKFDEEKVKKPFLIAQDVQAVLPEAVTSSVQSKDDLTEYLGIAYTEVIPLLVAAIKELKTIVDAQAAEIAELKAKVV